MSVSTIDPDQAWTIGSPDFKSNSWYSSPDGAFEKKLAKESVLDTFSGLNYNKMPVGVNEYYGRDQAPVFKEEFNEEEYYANLQPIKTDEEVQAELNEPVVKMEEKLQEFLDKGEEVVWTPALEQMSKGCSIPAARAIGYEISPYFQLNTLGYRKTWANTRICEYRPALRMRGNIWNYAGDYFFRFQMMRWNLTSKMRMRFWKMIMAAGFFGLCVDHTYARQYKRKLKWH